MDNQKGFTLIELMVVIGIIGILASIALPNFLAYRQRAYFCEGYSLFSIAQKNVSSFYAHTGRLPRNNVEAGLPQAQNIRGKYVESVHVNNGTILVHLNPEVIKDKVPKIEKVPVVSKDNPTGPLFWVDKGTSPESWMKTLTVQSIK